MARIDMDGTNEEHVKSMVDYVTAFGGKRFHLFVTDENEIIIRPAVTTRGIDTLYMKNLPKEKRKEVVGALNGLIERTFRCAAFRWSDDIKEKRTEDLYL